jgi:predicted  nucleic acid-binding Zn-ribbon protein
MARHHQEDRMWKKKGRMEKAAQEIGAAVGKAESTARAAVKAAQEGTRVATVAAEKGMKELSRTVAGLEKDLKKLRKRVKKMIG